MLEPGQGWGDFLGQPGAEGRQCLKVLKPQLSTPCAAAHTESRKQ